VVSGKCVHFGAGRSGVRLLAGSYQDLANWYCGLLAGISRWPVFESCLSSVPKLRSTASHQVWCGACAVYSLKAVCRACRTCARQLHTKSALFIQFQYKEDGNKGRKSSASGGRENGHLPPWKFGPGILKHFVNVQMHWNMKMISTLSMSSPSGKISADAGGGNISFRNCCWARKL